MPRKQAKKVKVEKLEDSLPEPTQEETETKPTNIKIDKKQLESAIEGVKKLVSLSFKDKGDFLADEEKEPIFANIVLNKIPVETSIRPFPVPVKNSVYPDNCRVCLIVKDPKAAFKDLKLEFPFYLKVIDVNKLRLKYGRFEKRRDLLKEFDLFLCDLRVYFVIKRHLGKPFYTAKKYPSPLNLDYEQPDQIKSEIIRLVKESSVFCPTNGPNYTVKIGYNGMTKQEISQNSSAILETISRLRAFGAEDTDVSSISIKANDTMELPVYNYLSKEEIEAFNSK